MKHALIVGDPMQLASGKPCVVVAPFETKSDAERYGHVVYGIRYSWWAVMLGEPGPPDANNEKEDLRHWDDRPPGEYQREGE